MTKLDRYAKFSTLASEPEHAFINYFISSTETMACRIKILRESLYSTAKHSVVASSLSTLVYLELGFSIEVIFTRTLRTDRGVYQVD